MQRYACICLTDTHLTMLSVKPKFDDGYRTTTFPPSTSSGHASEQLSTSKIHSLGSQEDWHAGKINRRKKHACHYCEKVHPCNYPIFKEGRCEEAKLEWEESPSYSSCFLGTSSVYEGFCHGGDSQHLPGHTSLRTLPPVPLAAWGSRWLFNRKKNIKRRTWNLINLVAHDYYFFF